MSGSIILITLGCLGGAIGCGIAGIASHFSMSRTENNHGRLIALSAIPALQTIFAIVLMILMNKAITAGSLSPDSGIKIGLFAGLAFLGFAIVQGACIKSMIQIIEKKPALLSKTFAIVGIIQGLSLLTFVFTMYALSPIL